MMTATFKTTKARALGIICVVLAVIIAVILFVFGYRRDPITKRKALHNGLDLKANYEPAYAMMHGEVHDAVSLEIEAVEVDIETLTQLGVKVLLGILQEEGSPSHATRAFDANHAIAPVYRIHQRAAHGSIEMLHQVGV